MKTRSKKYWARRNAAIEKSLQKNAEAVRDDIIRQYENAIEEINSDIHATFKAYVSNGIPNGAAEKLLNAAEHDKAYQELLKLYDETDNVKVKEDILARINAQAYGARISRLEGVKHRIYIQLRKVGNYAEKKLKTLYTNTLQESYYTNIYNIAEGLDCGIDFTVLPQRAIDRMLREPWKGSNYSERVWKHNDEFINAVQDTIETGIIAGNGTRRMAEQLKDFVNGGDDDAIRYKTERLTRTETSHFMNSAQLAAYEEIGIDQYQFLAALSERTCERCAALDGKIFYVKDAVEGKNFAPLHPNCRCITIMAGTMPGTRIARDPLTGKNYKVDGSMTFKEWKESLTPEQEEALNLHVRQMKNKSADKKQYEKYKSVLGAENVPKTFDAFQDLKYNTVEGISGLSLQYRDKNLQKKIRETYNLEIHEGKQGKHILGHNNYIEGRSYITVSLDEAQELVNKYAGFGEIQRDRNNRWTHKELVKADYEVGVSINKNLDHIPTSKFMIHYSKQGTHIVPSNNPMRGEQ